MSDQEIIQWDKRLADQVRRGWDNYKHLHIDLGVARLDQSYLIAGEYLYVEQSSSADAIAKIKLNRVNNDVLDLEKGVSIETVFIEVFITNDVLEVANVLNEHSVFVIPDENGIIEYLATNIVWNQINFVVCSWFI